MRDRIWTWRIWAAAIALVWCVAPVLAQTPSNIVIVGISSGADFADLQEGIQEAIRRSRAGAGRVLVIARDDGSPYGPISVPADANIEVRSLHVGANPEDRNPSTIVIQGVSTDAAVTVHTEDDPNFLTGTDNESPFEGGATDVFVLDGFAVTGGNNGVLVDETGPASLGEVLMPLFNRLYIHENFGGGGFDGNGIRTVGLAEPFVINCSIWGNGDRAADDEGAGISIGATGNLFSLHNTILLNENYGVHFEDAGTATIRNTIVYRNGDETEQSATVGEKDGGLVWDVDPFIDPNIGPVAGGIPVTLFGDFVGTSGFTNFNVHFGPPDLAPAVPVSGGAPNLTVTLPAAYRGVPGPVDVYIIRIGDGYEARVPIAFTYVNDAGDAPLVSQVVPEWGDVVGGNFVAVLGAGFERDCDVFFDFDGDAAIDTGEMSDKVTFLSSGELLVKVPEAFAPTKVEVYVINNRTALQSATTLPDDYEYRNSGGIRPSIVHINPNYFRDLEGTDDSAPGTSEVTSNVLVWNLEPADPLVPDPVVKIGDLVVPYASVLVVDTLFAPNPALDSDGGILYEIIDVEIPVAEFGAGGSYDVTVINPSGLSDTLNAGFTYYADGIPRPDPSGRVWRPANFVEDGVGGDFTLLGSGYDTTIAVSIIEALFGLPASGTSPYQSHTQRAIEFAWPANTVAFMGVPVGPPSGYAVKVENVSDADGDFSVDATVQTSDFHYVTSPSVFDIQNVQVLVSNTIDAIRATITNYDSLSALGSAFSIYVDDVDVGALTHLAAANEIYFNVPAPGAGVAGPVDIRIQTPNNPAPGMGDPLYYITEGGYSYRRAAPQAHGVFPRTIAADTTILPSPVRVRGADFTGPVNAGTPHTRVWLDSNGDDAFDAADIDLSQIAASYEIYSFSQIDFTVDLTPRIGPLPLGTPISIHLDTFDPVTATVLSGPTTLLDALIIDNTAPEITDVYLAGPPPNPTRRDGPVRGGTDIFIEGENFNAGLGSQRVRIGGEEAMEVVAPVIDFFGTMDRLHFRTPPAPDLLAGTYPVVVIRTADQRQAVSPLDKDFTYFLDGAPEILEIVPNHIPYSASGDDDPRYITIVGLNFTDIVQVVFDQGGANEQTIDHYSVSPTEIVVKVPLGADTKSVLPTPPGGEVAIPVFVRNVPADFTAVTATTNESNSVNIFVFDDGRGLVPNVAILEFNNVYHNSNDYVMVEPGTGSISIDPMFDPRDAPSDPGLPGPKSSASSAGAKLLNLVDDPWVGKLAIRDPSDGITGSNTDFENPMRDKGGEFTLSPFTALDFELDERPDFQVAPEGVQGTGPADSSNVQGLPDIGADEIVTVAAAAGQFGWYFASPIPNPVPALDEGDLSILVAFRPAGFVMDPFDANANFGGGTTNDVSFFLVPQGGDPNFDADKIPLSVNQDLGSGVYIVTNADNAIETLLEDRDATADPSAGDLIADGHAAIYVRPNPSEPFFVLGDSPTDLGDGALPLNGSVTISGIPVGPINDSIIEQAVLGRHFLIDTIPPRVNLASARYLDTIEAMEAIEAVFPEPGNDPGAANVVNPSTAHPTPGFVGVILPGDGSTWNPAEMLTPIDQNQTTDPFTPLSDFGVRLPSNTGPTSTSIFFNSFSVSNVMPAVDGPLELRVEIEMIDLPVVDSTNTLITGIDFYTGTDDLRQVSGFESSFSTPAVDGNENVLDGPVRWDTIRGASLLLDTVATPVQISNDFATSGANLGVFNLTLEPTEAMSDPPNPLNDSDNGAVVASWGGPVDATTDPMVFADPTEHLFAALTGGFNLSIQFDGEDLAGNDSTDEPDETLLNPLNIYWYRDANSEIAGISEGAISSNPIPTFSLVRAGDPSPAPDGGPTSIYSFRAYFSDAYRGIYNPVPTPTVAPFVDTWTAWTASQTIINLADVLPADSWILLVVHSADEAGNVEPWDLVDSDNGPLDMTVGVGDLLHQYALDQPNWVRFGFTGSPPPDTRVRANFWHDDKANNDDIGFAPFPTRLVNGEDSNLGNLTIVPMPGNETVTNQRVAAEFFISVDVPPDFNDDADNIEVDWEFFGDGVLLLNGTIVLQVAAETRTITIPNLNDDAGLGDPNLEEDITYVFRARSRIQGESLSDGSPASVLFTVVPLDAQTFVAQALDPDRQPIVILEEQ